MIFLYVLFFIGILIASIQDIRRREVDNYINFFLLASGLVYIVFLGIFNDYNLILLGLLAFVVMFLLANLFYYSRIFAGGDAKLMIALSALFVAASIKLTLINIGIFLVFLIISGSVYGILYSVYLVSSHYSDFKKDLKKYFWFKYGVAAAVVLFVFSYFNLFFLLLAIFALFPVLFAVAKSIENVCMIKEISGKELREGDWIAQEVSFKGKKIKPDWEGLTKKQVLFLSKIKKIKVKEGLPFVPAFLIAFIFYYFKDYFFGLVI